MGLVSLSASYATESAMRLHSSCIESGALFLRQIILINFCIFSPWMYDLMAFRSSVNRLICHSTSLLNQSVYMYLLVIRDDFQVTSIIEEFRSKTQQTPLKKFWGSCRAIHWWCHNFLLKNWQARFEGLKFCFVAKCIEFMKNNIKTQLQIHKFLQLRLKVDCIFF